MRSLVINFELEIKLFMNHILVSTFRYMSAGKYFCLYTHSVQCVHISVYVPGV